MMNKILIGITTMAICLATFTGCKNMKNDLTTDKASVFTEKYSNAQVEELKNTSKTEQITFSKFKKDFDVVYSRRTHQGRYVVLLLEDGKNAFVFFNNQNTLTDVMIFDGFMSKIEFRAQAEEKTCKSEILSFDSNTILAPISSIEVTAHIVQEGIYIVKYTRFSGNEIIKDPVVTSIEFVENDSIPTNDDPFIRDVIPFIFASDKKAGADSAS